MALDPTPAGSTSDSYVTLQEANTYMAGRVAVDAWDAADATAREAALRMAALRLEQEQYRGRRYSNDQALAWPRADVWIDGRLATANAVPEPVKRAQMEMALAILAGETLADSGLEGFESVKVGPIEVTPRHDRRAGALPAAVQRMLAPVLLTPSTGNFRFLRG